MNAGSAETRLKVWDIWIRVFHWSLALAVGFLLLSGETGFLFYDWHRNVGEFVLALLLFRIVWGFVGSSNASLIGLVQHPRNVFVHLMSLLRGHGHQDRGHNAAGGWAVLLLIVLLSFQAISGMFIADEDELIEGAFYGELNSGMSERLLQLHHTVAEILMIFVAIHVAMVFFYLIRAGQNLITPMLTGHMKWSGQEKPPAVRFAHSAIGLVLFIVCLAAIGLLTGWLK